jgi:hypothetical protein
MTCQYHPRCFRYPTAAFNSIGTSAGRVEIEVERDGKAHVLATDANRDVAINSDLALGDRMALRQVQRASADLSPG